MANSDLTKAVLLSMGNDFQGSCSMHNPARASIFQKFAFVRLMHAKLTTAHHMKMSDCQRRMTLGVAMVSLLILAPFAINNLYRGNLFLATGVFLIMAIMAASTWSISNDRYNPALTLYGLVPAIIFFLAIAIRNQGMIGVLWCYPSLVTFYFMLPEKKAWIANLVLLVVSLTQACFIFEANLVARMAATLALESIFSAIFLRIITEHQVKIEQLAVTDALTGLHNRVLLHNTLDHAIQQHARQGTPMTLAILDLDHFKAINDEFGHDAGDRVLRAVGSLLTKRLRAVDKIFRLGGEEFLVLLNNVEADKGRLVADELRCAVKALPCLTDRTVTVSAGLAALQPGEDWELWMKRCDANLYEAKETGRDRVVG